VDLLCLFLSPNPSSSVLINTEQNGGRRPRRGTQTTGQQGFNTTPRSPSTTFPSPRPQVQEEEQEEKEEEDGKGGAPWVEGSMCEEAENVKDHIDRFRDRTNHKMQRRRS